MQVSRKFLHVSASSRKRLQLFTTDEKLFIGYSNQKNPKKSFSKQMVPKLKLKARGKIRERLTELK